MKSKKKEKRNRKKTPKLVENYKDSDVTIATDPPSSSELKDIKEFG